MFTLPEDIQKRYQVARNNREDWRSFLDTAYRYILPNRNYWDSAEHTKEPEGKLLNDDVYDITAPLAARSFVAKLTSVLTPPFQNWSQYVAGSAIPEGRKKGVNEFLQEENEKLFKFINQSNFSLAISECYMDLICGTAALLIEEGDDDNPLLFSCEPIEHLGFEEDSTGVIQSVYRDHFDLKFRDIENKWPDAKLPTDLTEQARKDSEATFNFMDAIIYDEEKKEYTYYVTWTATHEVVWTETTESQKFIVFRWGKLSGEIFGRGIAHDVLPTVLTLNMMIKLMLEASEIGAFPPFIGFQDNMFNPTNLQLNPKTIIPVKSVGAAGQLPLRPLEFNPNLQLAQLDIQAMQGWIQKAFFTDPLGPVDAPRKTATEVSLRQQEFLEEVGAAFGRLEVEFLSRIVQRCTFILRKRGDLDKDLIIDGKRVTLDYQSPLAQLQSQQELQSFSLANQVLQGILGQFSIAALNLEEIPEWIAEKSNADLTLFKDKESLGRLADDIRKNMLAQLGDQPQQELPPAQPLGSPQQLIPTQPPPGQ